ncbi:hypothetical protein ELI49_00780 [Rhizobium ruizarguesonis]|nr:hypothetical protein ELI49_00780 [Rhizobium ruizarguesonis]TAW75857.1 hypothetical protein ELI10_00780 [Rhizobium ruizarguesonis]TAX12812.1 hypothetical protein ELI09_00790 [Rhizobium ruizarguesonis]TAX17643.1 hypothetical protein ELI08_00780 [Rhizobium ruizarguesonis]
MAAPAPHPNLTGVEPLVSPRPPDPRKNGERGRVLQERGGNGDVAACPLLPSGRRCRQADEGATRHTPLS